MASASEILSAIAPEFDSVSSRATFLDMAESRTSSTFFGGNRSQAVALRAAHMLALTSSGSAERIGGAGGPVSSKSEGQLSVSFGSRSSSSSSADSDLEQTSFGIQLLGLQRASGAAVQVGGRPFVLATMLPVRGY